MIWNPWREIRRLRRELQAARTVAQEALDHGFETNGKLAQAYDARFRALRDVEALKRIVQFLCERDGIDPQMIQCDDLGVVRLGLPPEAETRGTA